MIRIAVTPGEQNSFFSQFWLEIKHFWNVLMIFGINQNALNALFCPLFELIFHFWSMHWYYHMPKWMQYRDTFKTSIRLNFSGKKTFCGENKKKKKIKKIEEMRIWFLLFVLFSWIFWFAGRYLLLNCNQTFEWK